MWLFEAAGRGRGDWELVLPSVEMPPKGNLILQPSAGKFCSYRTTEDERQKTLPGLHRGAPEMRKKALSY